MENNNDDHRNGDSSHLHPEPLEHSLSKKPRVTRFITEPEIREEFAHHRPGVARVNNGSFGSCPGSVLWAQRDWQLEFLGQPDDFYFNTLRKGILHSRTLIKSLINADDVEEVSLVDNATTAAAIVLQHIGRGFSEGNYAKGDSVVMLHCAYEAVKKSIHAYVARAGGSVVEVQLPFPLNSKEEIVSEFRKGLERGKLGNGKVRLAIIDHITSMPSVVTPVKEMVKMCRDEGVDQVFVDAAHAIGSVDVDVKEIGADFYVSNLHKWFFCPPSVSFLYCKRLGSGSDVHHPVVSHEYGNGLPIESAWIGTRDYSSQLVVPKAFEFVERFEGGLHGIMKKNHEEVVKMGRMLAASWRTNLGTPEEMCAGMAMVGLPSRLGVSSADDALRLRSHLRAHFGVEVPIYYHASRDGEEGQKDSNGLITAYVRVSHQVYNTFGDYCKLRDAINELVENRLVCRKLLVKEKD